MQGPSVRQFPERAFQFEQTSLASVGGFAVKDELRLSRAFPPEPVLPVPGIPVVEGTATFNMVGTMKCVSHHI